MEPEDKKFFEDLAKGQFDFETNEPDPGDPPIIYRPELVKAATVGRKSVHQDQEESEEEKSLPIKDEGGNEPEEFEGEEGQLTIDVYQTDDHIIVKSTVAGVDPEDLEINITAESVTIRGARRQEEKVEEKDYLYQECFWGRFSRSVILPQEVDADKSVASLKNGILTIKMPKLNKQKAKKLKIKFD